MRYAAQARDTAARAAAAAVLAAGGNAVDAAVAGMLAGATRASNAALLGSGALIVAGPGMGSWYVDGRARGPGRGEKRPHTPGIVPPSWGAAVPGLLDGVLAAHTRFGSMALGPVVRAALEALRESGPDAATQARMKLVDQLARRGLPSLERLGVLPAVLRAAGPVAGGLFTREDLQPFVPALLPLATRAAEAHEVLQPPEERPSRPPSQVPPAPPAVDVDGLVCLDLLGVLACAVWAVAPEAVPLEDVPGLSLARLAPMPAKGVPRWPPGVPLPLPQPLAIVRQGGRNWAGVALSGGGALEAALDVVLATRLGQAGIRLEDGGARPPVSAGGVALWVVRDREGEELRATMAPL